MFAVGPAVRTTLGPTVTGRDRTVKSEMIYAETFTKLQRQIVKSIIFRLL